MEYLGAHPEVISVLFTGGDPMVMKTSLLRRYIEPLLDPRLDHVLSIPHRHQGSPYWPPPLRHGSGCRRCAPVVRARSQCGPPHSGHGALQPSQGAGDAHRPGAIRRIHSAGGTVRCQAPLIRHVNDAATRGSSCGLARCASAPCRITCSSSGIRGRGTSKCPSPGRSTSSARVTREFRPGRTVRGPSMSATPGKVLVVGTASVHGEEVFVLMFIQARDPAGVGKMFFAKYEHGGDVARRPHAGSWQGAVLLRGGSYGFWRHFTDVTRSIPGSGKPRPRWLHVWRPPAVHRAGVAANHPSIYIVPMMGTILPILFGNKTE